MHIVRSQDDGGSGQADQLDALDQVELSPVVESEGGLVQEENLRPMHEGLDQAELPLHSERVRTCTLVARIPQARPAKELLEAWGRHLA